MRFLALILGKGEGCDYTIACNKDFQMFENMNERQFKEWAVEYLKEQGDRVADMKLFMIEQGNEIEMPTKDIIKQQERELERELERRIQDHEDQVNELKAKLGRLK